MDQDLNLEPGIAESLHPGEQLGDAIPVQPPSSAEDGTGTDSSPELIDARRER
jgi:hypothetical protein